MSNEMTTEELCKVLKLHKMWLNGEEGGEIANLTRANLREANLTGADLAGASLRDACLVGTNLEGANLTRANLREANLTGADLAGASLRDACLVGTNLEGANLTRASLTGADLTRASLTRADLTRASLTRAGLDFSCLPLWCGSQFKADERICKQLVAHTLRIMELSGQGSEKLRELMSDYKKGWHRENEF